MANQNQSGRNIRSISDEQRPSWRTQEMRDDRDDERSMSDRDRGRRDLQDEGYRMSERYGQGQSGYTAGRYGEDRSLGFENRNQGYGGRYEDRQQSGMGTDDRFSGRGGQGYYQGAQGMQGGQGWQGGREGYGRLDEGLGQRGTGDRGFGGAENRGYSSGYTVGGQGGFGGQSGYPPQTPYYPSTEGREGYGMPGMGRTGGYAQSIGGGRSMYGGGSQSFSAMGGSYGGFGQSVGGGMQGGYGQQGSTQSGFGQEMRGMYRGKGPLGWQRSDERIREAICETLTDDEFIDASNIEVKVTNGEVFLLGSVPDRMMKRMAEDVIERVSGVKDVTNQLKVGKEQDRSNPSMSRGVGQREPEPTGSKHRA